LFSVDNPTLNRIYSLHYTFPFLLAGLSIFHIAALHQYGSTNPLGVNTQTSTVPFGMYFASKDLLGLLILLFAFAILVFFYPEMLGHPDNLIPANPYSTPQHIVPEWYFLWFYAILRSIPNKAMGVVAIAITFASLIAMPFLSTTHIGSPKFRVMSERLFFVFVADLGLLTWVGAREILDSTILLGQVCTVILFIYLVILYPFLSMLESKLYLNGIKLNNINK
jgi:ubiquinol-cytochrome c reductase cytochrome b subunit